MKTIKTFSPSEIGFYPFFSVAVLIASIGIDLVPRFHLGDSGAYLLTGTGGYLPQDRSWAYGYLIVGLLSFLHDLAAIPLLQIVSLWICSLLIVHAIRWRFHIGTLGRTIAFMALFANPLDFYWSRAIMTDEWAACGFYLIVYILLTRNASPLSVFAVFVLGLTISSLRIIYLVPLMISFAVTLVVMVTSAALNPNYKIYRSDVVKPSLYFLCLLSANVVYGTIDAAIHQKHSIFGNQGASAHVLAAWSPALGQDAIDSIGLSAGEKRRLRPLTYDQRHFQLHTQDGLINVIAEHFSDEERARREYRRLMIWMVLNQPIILADIIARSWSDYLDPPLVALYHRSLRWSGAVSYRQPNVINDGIIKKLKDLGVWQNIAANIPSHQSLSLDYFSVGAFWALLLSIYATFVAPAIAFIVARRNQEWDIVTIQFFGFTYMAMVALASGELVTRYLLPLGAILVIGAAYIYAIWRDRQIACLKD